MIGQTAISQNSTSALILAVTQSSNIPRQTIPGMADKKWMCRLGALGSPPQSPQQITYSLEKFHSVSEIWA
jgi:hypothetical protein